jgi:GH24 family phage-related lysozyme (muramidase)
MSNRFLEQSRPRAVRVRPGRHPTFSSATSWATAMAATDRALVILVENGGVDLGIPDLVDTLLKELPGSSAIPSSFRAALVKAIEDKIKEYTDTLLETVELAVNAYQSAKPGLYGDVVVLRNGAATLSELKTQLQALTRQQKIIDVYVLTHGGSDRICAHDNAVITGNDIRAIKTDLGRALSIRSVYMMNCVGSTLNQAWLDAGAKCSSGSIRNNYLPEPTMHFFWEKWKAGETFENAATGAYRETINLMNSLVRGIVGAIPIVGSDLAASIDFATFDFVRDSAPVVQGQRSLTITSDALTFTMSAASSLATTVLPAALLQTLSEPDAGAASGAPQRTVSDAGIELIKSFEGFRAQMYNDPVGHCTIGYGTLLHTGNCDGRPAEQPYASGVDEARATELLRQKVAEFQQVVNDRVSVPLNQNQNDALVSFVYNIGGAAFGSSTMLRVLNESKYDQVPGELRKWTKARKDGQVVELPGLVKRRTAEAELFAKPVATAQSLSLLSGAMGAVDYTVPGLVASLQQNAPMTCWATVITMMESWRRQASIPVQTVLERAGQEWVDRYNRGEGLNVNLAKSLYDALGLVSLISQNPTIEYWEQLLRTYGPLYVDVGAGPTSTHALIVTGIRGSGTETGTNITFVDPGSGQVVNQRFDAFRQRYEAPSAVDWPYVITHWPAGTTSGQQSLPMRYSHSYEAPSTAQAMTVLSTQMNPLLIAGIEVADAAQIGLGAISVVQAGAAASGGTLTLTFDKAQRLLTSEARAAMPGAQSGKNTYSALVFSIGIGAINAANADIIVEWEGNAYGEVSTPIFRKQLETSTDWSRSSAVITITKLDTIPPANTDPREWPIVYHFEGNYDPYGNGLFEFTGEFEINAFGGLKFNKHQVVSRSLADFAIGGTPEDKVARGRDIAVTVPAIPAEQVAYLRSRLP